METFAVIYKKLFEQLCVAPYVEFSCRGLSMWKELAPVHLTIDMKLCAVSVFSCATHRVTPIKFALAELCYILAGRDDVESIASYNKGMEKYSEDGGKTISGSYGKRLQFQLEAMIERLFKDQYTRQACAIIYNKTDAIDQKITHMPCNIFLQFLCRHPFLNLHVISRSSDFVTGFSIDTIHWQFLLLMMKNELRRHGGTIIVNKLYYTLTSLHIYNSDRDIVRDWSINDNPYEHYIETSITLTNAIHNCRKYFKGGMSLEDLCALLELSDSSRTVVNLLHELFKEHRNQLTR